MNRVHHPQRPVPPSPTIAIRALALAALMWGVPGVAAAAEGGLVLVPEPRLLLTLILLFIALIFPVNAMVFKPLLRVLDEREERTAGTRARADKLERDAAEVLARYESAVQNTRQESEGERRGLLEQVRAEVGRETASARSDAEQRIEQARGELDTTLEEARQTLRSEAQQLAREAATQVLGRAL